MVDVCADFSRPHVAWVALLMKQNELATPVSIAGNRAMVAVPPRANDRQLFKYPRWFYRRGSQTPLAYSWKVRGKITGTLLTPFDDRQVSGILAVITRQL
jgi:hypothetical protein